MAAERAAAGGAPLVERVDALFAEQLASWPLLRSGVEGIADAPTRRVVAAGGEMLVRLMAHRAKSTTAAVDAASIAKRPCFLCPENLYPEQRGLAFGEYTVYANPFPVLSRHLTVVHREHRPQRLAEQLGPMLDLAAALPGFFVIYNGPRCGASAPDHAHLQAGSSGGLPLLELLPRAAGQAVEVFGAKAFVFSGAREDVRDAALRALALLSDVARQEPEPWCNAAAVHDEAAGHTLVLFPRSKHRPDAFHAGTLTVSPAAIDMCGILVTPVAEHLDRLTGERVAAVFREVTLDEASFREVAARLEAVG